MSGRAMFGRVVVTAVVVLASAALSAATAPSQARSLSAMSVPAGSDPKANVAVPAAYGANCVSTPSSSACYATLESMLNSGRAAVGKPAYKFFAHFTSLTGREQILALVNQDRGAYGLPVVVGMNSTLQSAANSAAVNRTDPAPVSSIGGYSWRAYGSNVFTAYVKTMNPLFAYFNWMYTDGPGKGGTNSECQGSAPRNCWIHRHNNLTIYPSGTIGVLGVGLAGDSAGTWPTSTATQLFEAFTSSLAIPTMPTIIGLSPATGPHTGGTAFLIAGYGFRSVTSITICSVTATSIVVKSISTITAKTGRVAAATACNVVVKTRGGSSISSAANYFKYT